MVDFFDLIDIPQNNSCTVSRGGTDDDVAASQDLLDQGLGVADALNFIESKRLVKAGQDAAFAGDAMSADNIELFFAQQDNIQKSDYDNQDCQDYSAAYSSQIHFSAVENCTVNSTGHQCPESDA